MSSWGKSTARDCASSSSTGKRQQQQPAKVTKSAGDVRSKARPSDKLNPKTVDPVRHTRFSIFF